MPTINLNPETHEYTLDGKKLPGVTKILREAGLIDFSRVRPGVMAAAQQFGVAVHKACELFDKGILNIDILSKPLIPYLDGWAKFKKDYGLYFIADEIEKPVYSLKWGFIGTPDRIGASNMFEVKSNTQMQPATAIQTAAYDIAYEEMTGKKIKRRWGVQLNDKGTYKITEYKEKTDRSIFLSALQVYKWKEKNL